MSLEMLSDEVILIICSYLSQSDILQAFNDLNYRLNCTISDYRKHMDLTKAGVDQFMNFCQMLLRSTLGVTMRSVVLSNKKPVVKQVSFFEKQMHPVELNLPYLESLTLKNQSFEELDLFLFKVLWLQKLRELKLHAEFSYDNGGKLKGLVNDFFSKIMTKKNELQKLTFDLSTPISVNNVALRSNDTYVNTTLTHLTISISNTDDLILIIDGFSCLQYLNVRMKELNILDPAR
jgi:hypothetical protein